MPKHRRPAIRRYHDRIASRYDEMNGDAFLPWHDMLTWDYLKPHLPRGKWRLDVGPAAYRAFGGRETTAGPGTDDKAPFNYRHVDGRKSRCGEYTPCAIESTIQPCIEVPVAQTLRVVGFEPS